MLVAQPHRRRILRAILREKRLSLLWESGARVGEWGMELHSPFPIPSRNHPASQTTIFNSRPGTKITFFGAPVTNLAIGGSASAAA
jgi:hypothetical protein